MKLSDFGISKELDGSAAMLMSAVGSFRYMSPERLLAEKYDSSADIWSVAITIIELWTKAYPFKYAADNPVGLSGEFERIDFERLLPRSKYSPLMRQFLISMLQVQPNRR